MSNFQINIDIQPKFKLFKGVITGLMGLAIKRMIADNNKLGIRRMAQQLRQKFP